MWSLLHRNQESLLVGTAISLLVLALLSHGRLASPQATQTILESSTISRLHDVPRDPQFYASQWRRIATEFYDAHPFDSVERTIPVIAASLSARRETNLKTPLRAKPVSHQVSQDAIDSHPSPATPKSIKIQLRLQPTLVGPPAVAAALSAGILAMLLYRFIWPTVIVSKRNAMTCSDELRIELPSAWVYIRPSLRCRLKSLVLTGSYITAAVAAWLIVI